MSISTADLSDQFEASLTLLNVVMQSYGTRQDMAGQVVTLKAYEDNSFVRKLLSEKGKGKILVVDGGGSRRCALVGDQIAQLAIDNEWAGLVIYGCIRDSQVINRMDIGVKAIGTCPIKSVKRNTGVVGENLLIEGTIIKENQFLYSDADGILLSDQKLI